MINRRWRRQLFPALLGIGFGFAGTVQAEVLFYACNGCHGTNGVSQGSHVPSIAGLNFRYFYATMQAYRKDRRPSLVMGRIAKGFRSAQLQRMALHYGAQPWVAQTPADVDPVLAERGQVLHREYCEECHEQNGHFQDKETPPLAGQARGYLLNQMRDYRVAAAIMPQPALMQERLEKMSDEDLAALAEFFGSPLARPQPGSSAPE